MTSFFSVQAWVGPIWIKFWRLVQNDVDCCDVVEIETRCRINSNMADVSANSMSCHPTATCHTAGLLPHGEFNVMIPELRVTLQGAATRQIQWHVIPEPRITLQGPAIGEFKCHDSRATCHIAG